MINAVIIDDEKNNIDNLKGLLLKHCHEVKVVAEAMNAGEGVKMISQYQPELILLDIQMPGKNGFEMLQSLPNRDFEIIFVTAFDQYGIQAIKFSAIDYLLKPVNIDELKTAGGKVVEKKKKESENLRLENLLQYLQNQQQKTQHRLALATVKETRFVNTDEIIRCESSNAYTSFYLTGGEKIVVSKPIFEYEELLKDYGFIRCHQSHLVNKSKVKSWIRKQGDHLLMEDNSQIPVSRNKKEIVSGALVFLKK